MRMRIYTERPKARTARKVWDWVTKKRGQEPCKLWKNPNCWGCFSVAGNGWGWWIAEYGRPEDSEWIPPTSTWKDCGMEEA